MPLSRTPSLEPLLHQAASPQTHYHKHVSRHEPQNHPSQLHDKLDQKLVLSYYVAPSNQRCGIPVVGEPHVALQDVRTALIPQK